MNARQKTCWTGRRGIALLVTLIFLTLFACLAVWIAASADANLTIAHNRIEGQQALAMAGTGLQLIKKSLSGMEVGDDVIDAAGMHAAIRDHLAAYFATPGMLDADDIEVKEASPDGIEPACVTVPTIALLTRADGRQGFVTLSVQCSSATEATITSTGNFGSAWRKATYGMIVQRGKTVMAKYGIASMGPVQMKGYAQILGAHDPVLPSDGSVLSADAIQLKGNSHIAGDAAVVNSQPGSIQVTGSATIGGAVDPPTDDPEWPVVDISDFKPFATKPYIAGDPILSNVRIPASTTPRTLSNVTILGVLYIEPPNQVTFSGTTTITGVIVTDEPSSSDGGLAANYIKFTGNVSTYGVENLPTGADYDGLRDLTGSFLLAPGFSAQFTGNSNTVNGCMVASEFKFGGDTGNPKKDESDTMIRGGIVNLRDSVFQVGGHARLVVDLQDPDKHPAGIKSSTKLVCVPASYSEE